MHYLFFKVKPKDICLIKQILESYEHMMLVSTVDEDLPKIQVTVAPDFLNDCKKILEDLKGDFLLIQVDEPSNKSQGHY